jgi:hypothetical protein
MAANPGTCWPSTASATNWPYDEALESQIASCLSYPWYGGSLVVPITSGKV